ncbi:MAG: FHA domain-containing protein [Planctomycetes bacterium]|nr:FHA domain-containing protein [Planctomycetota bacterium]
MAALPPLALRLSGQDHALEIGRDYVLGSAADCDLILPADRGVAAHHARLRVGDDTVELQDLGSGETFCNGAPVVQAALRPGDTLRLGALAAELVPDHGSALLVPEPALRAAALTRRQRRVRHAALALLRRRDSESFQELMADELRRAPWLGVSLVLHALLLLALWLLVPNREGGDDAPKTVAIDVGAAVPAGDPLPLAPEVVADAPPVDFAPLPDVEPEPASTRAIDPTLPAARPTPPANARLAPRASGAGGGSGSGDRSLAAEVQTVGSGGFRRAVADLRRSGLEIVFVFDSTGSMSRTILDTKNSIAQMLAVLRALVPDARVGIVTYRDRGRREDYLVRQVPLGLDFWRASNFVQVVSAEGGGDQPEDVRAGLRAAFAQHWRPDARRVVVLAGDAPPHLEDIPSLLADVRGFARNGRSFVHTLVTSPDTAGKETRAAFADIAAAGKGTSTDLKAHEKVLQRVLALAFGHDFEADVAAVVQTVQAAAERVDVASLDLAHRGGPDLERALRTDPVPVTLLQALVRRPRRAVALELIDQLGSRSTPEPTRHAIAWVLQRVFTLPLPPVDPERGEPPDAAALSRLQRRAEDLPD